VADSGENETPRRNTRDDEVCAYPLARIIHVER
jgi:hypothetical protein